MTRVSTCFLTLPKGKDPDELSKTLNSYHQMLWSKKLPNGKMMLLEKGKEDRLQLLKRLEISKQFPEINPKQFLAATH